MSSSWNRREFLCAAAGAASGRNRPPNIVFILADDLGYGDLGAYGSNLSTPNLDRMAREGVRFTNFYSANPVCSPSRAALMTGRYPTRVGVPRVLFPTDTTGLPDDETTLAQLLKGRRYRTACVGKWHLGHLPRFLPTRRGFDSYFGIPYSNDMKPRPLMEGTSVVEAEATLDTLTPRYTERAVRFIEQSKGSPFFLYIAHTYPHVPLAASRRFLGSSRFGLYGDVVAELDWSVGQVLAALKKTGVDRDTLVMFTSDNGPSFEGSPGRLRGRKAMTWEGGVREPFLARWPGRIPAGGVARGIASMMDILPTVAGLCGAPLPSKPLDGIDIWPLINGKTREIEREALLYFDNWNLECARQGRWKLHLARYNSMSNSPRPPGGRINLLLPQPELYDLEKDPGESYDAASRNPQVVKDLVARVEQLLKGFPAEVRKAWDERSAREAAPSYPGQTPRLK